MEESPRGGEKVSIIGAGKVGTAVAALLSGRGWPVVRVFDPSAKAVRQACSLTGAQPAKDPAGAALEGDVVLLTTPDDAIEAACRGIASAVESLAGKVFMHMSGVLPLSALEPAARLGARVLCVHPLQTFADVEGAIRALPGSTFGVTCPPEMEGWARAFVSALGGSVLPVRDEDKVLYHAAAVIASNLMVMVEYGAQRLYRLLGLVDEDAKPAFMPLVRATVENIERLGPVKALTGPLARGDAGTLRANLEAIESCDTGVAELYRAVSLWGLELVAERGELEEPAIEEMRRLLGGGC